ncbi:hypothetical protein PLICRDRAFT_176889 [Plicaturopsis crispa FD-325 SS-3]|nr:hypothetical protein PLICRDRAFT_176889 [Plicaturopsis crispa FD-325 SS-3]
MSSNTVYLVSGANRGLGFGLVKALVLRDNVIIFAGARDPAAATNLQALAKQYPGKIHLIKLVSASKEDSEAAATLVRKVAGHIDVLIANAGIADTWAHAHEVPTDEVERHFKVNAIGPLVLFQAFYSLLKESPSIPKFAVISTAAGSIQLGAAIPLGVSAYGPSKAAVNFLTRNIHFENERLIAFALHPGTVVTEGLQKVIEKVPETANFPQVPIEESINGLLARIDEATREKTGGTFLSYDGEAIAW